MAMIDAVDLAVSKQPKFNKIIGEGLAYHTCTKLETVIDKFMSSLLSRENDKRLPKGFSYIGYEVLSPVAEYMYRKQRANKQQKHRQSNGLQYSKNDFYIVCFKFKAGDSIIERYIEIPFIRPGSIMHINSTKYSIMPVITAKGISITTKGLFVAFGSNRVNFEKITRSIIVDGISRHINMPHTIDLHRQARKSKNIHSPIFLWLLAKFGAKEVAKKFLGVNAKFYHTNEPRLEEYSKEEYSFYKPTWNKTNEFSPDITIVIPKEHNSKEFEMFAASIFYTMSVFGDRMSIENINQPDIWKIMLGYTIWGDFRYPDVKTIDEICTHLGHIEKYIDDFFIDTLQVEGIDATDIYQFLFCIVQKICQCPSGKGIAANMFGKYLTSMEYIVNSLRYDIQNAAWELIRLAAVPGSDEGGVVTENKIRTFIFYRIQSTRLLGLNHGNGAIRPFQLSCDNMLVGLTSRAIDQVEATKKPGSDKKNMDLNDPTKHTHSSHLSAGSVCNLPKSSPIGWGVLNPYINIDHLGRIIPHPDEIDVLNEVQIDLSQKGI